MPTTYADAQPFTAIARPAEHKTRKKFPREDQKKHDESLDQHRWKFEETKSAWHGYTWAKCNELSEELGNKPEYYHERLFFNGPRPRKEQEHTNASHAWRWHIMKDAPDGAMLLDIMRDRSNDYSALLDEEKAAIIASYEEHKTLMHTGKALSQNAKTKLVDEATKKAEQIFSNLNLSTGAQAFYCVMSGDAQHHMDAIWYFTNEKLETYMPVAVGNRWNTGRVGTKLTSYAIANCDLLKTLRSSGDKVQYLKSSIRERLNASLSEVTGDPAAQMQYSTYEQAIVQHYSVELVGWTFKKFANPSELGNSIAPLQELVEALESGICKFVRLTSDELKQRRLDKEATNEGAVAPPPAKQRKKRSDAGKKRSERKKRTAADVDADENDKENAGAPDKRPRLSTPSQS